MLGKRLEWAMRSCMFVRICACVCVDVCVRGGGACVLLCACVCVYICSDENPQLEVAVYVVLRLRLTDAWGNFGMPVQGGGGGGGGGGANLSVVVSLV